MKFFTFSVAALLSLFPIIQAQGGFYKSCENSTFTYVSSVTGSYPNFVQHGTLSGGCVAPNGSYITSSLDLNACITNNNGNLQWKVDGEFERSCSCNIDSLPQLCCTCELNNNAEKPDVCIDLDEQVTDVGGQLECPDVPTS